MFALQNLSIKIFRLNGREKKIARSMVKYPAFSESRNFVGVPDQIDIYMTSLTSNGFNPSRGCKVTKHLVSTIKCAIKIL